MPTKCKFCGRQTNTRDRVTVEQFQMVLKESTNLRARVAEAKAENARLKDDVEFHRCRPCDEVTSRAELAERQLARAVEIIGTYAAPAIARILIKDIEEMK